MAVKITDNVTWVGKIDWDLNKFHGEEYSTFKGSSYNAYLVRGEKTALVDTVYRPFAREFVDGLAREIDLSRIDFVVANHAEVDHSGALPELLRRIPDVPVYCTANAVKSLRGHYHADWNFRTVGAGDTLDLGGRSLTFIPAPMLHWPDSMFCYLDTDAILFSNDAFGHHYASEAMFADLVDQAGLEHECLKYYANILTPFSRMVTKKIEEFAALKLPLTAICPSHGLVWRKDPMWIVGKYLEWAADYQENQVTVIYDTMWDATREMADAIAKGVRAGAPGTTVKVLHVGHRDKNEIVTEIFKSRLVAAGCSTINRGLLSAMTGILEMVKGLSFRNKLGAAFGSYGWSGESVGLIEKWLAESGLTLAAEGLKINWRADAEGLARCEEFGRTLAARL